MASSSKHPTVINGLRILWVILVFWYELGIFNASVRGCRWPDSYLRLKHDAQDGSLKPAHVLLVADPQIIDRHSYPSRGPLLYGLTRFLVDLNLRKNWRVALQKQPDAIVFLGDMMDNGRYAMPEEEYEEYYQRFSRIFSGAGDTPMYFIPGNHDTGLGISSQFSSDARSRYSAHFGAPNRAISIANHTLVLFDAPNYADEDSLRHGKKKSFESWTPVQGGALAFMKDFANDEPWVWMIFESLMTWGTEQHTDPVILFSHIPLHRQDGKGCGLLREKGSIRPGVGFGYQNMLEKKSSQRLLESFKPTAVFSGDDHDYCEYNHELLLPRGPPLMIREVTVKTLSMVMNVRKPGFQLLSLTPADLRRDTKHTYFDTPCNLPDQLGIYLNSYLPLLAFSLLLVFVMNIHDETLPYSLKSKAEPVYDVENASPSSSGSSPGWFILQGQRRQLHSGHTSSLDWAERMKERLSSLSSAQTSAVLRRQSWLWASLHDVWRIAVFPICTFALVTWWVLSH